MRSGTPKKDHENVITVYGGTDLWKQRLEFQSPDAAYLIFLDHSGVVRWRNSGVFDEEAYKELSIRVAALLQGQHQPSCNATRIRPHLQTSKKPAFQSRATPVEWEFDRRC
jgi:hypothetical protein